MQRRILILGLFITILLTGCNDNQNINNNKAYQDTLEQLEKTKSEKNELEKELNDEGLKIKELEKQIKDLKKEIVKQGNKNIEEGYVTKHKVLRIIDANENGLKYIFHDMSIAAQTTSIIGHNIDGLVEDYEELQVKGLGSGEYFRAEVTGSIYDFQLIQLEWNDKTNEFVEVKAIYELDEVRNQAICIETILPCGMPSEKIKWKDSKGDIHEIFLANDGYGFAGSIIWSE